MIFDYAAHYRMREDHMAATGADYDFAAALEYHPQEGFTFFDVAEVLAVVEGEHDGPSWYWLARMGDGRFLYLTGGCDYTGWDCQSWADGTLFSTLAEAVAATPETEEYSPKRDIRAQLQAQLDAKQRARTAGDDLNELRQQFPQIDLGTA